MIGPTPPQKPSLSKLRRESYKTKLLVFFFSKFNHLTPDIFHPLN